MADSRKIYVAGVTPGAGSSVVALGLLGSVERRVSKVGFFKPVGEGASDPEVALMKSAYHLAPEPNELCPFSVAEARRLVGRGKEQELLDRIAASFDVVRGTSDFVVLLGINQQVSVNAFDMDINASVAARLGAPVLLVAGASAGAGEVPPQDLASAVLAGRASFEEEGCEILGAVVNRVPEETAARKYAEVLEAEGIRVFGVIPQIDFITMPRLKHVAEALGAEVLSGRDLLSNISTRTLVAGMEPRNFLKWLTCDNTLVIAPGDREDIILTVAMVQLSSRHRRVSGLVLTGGFKPDSEIISLVKESRVPDFPILLAGGDTYSVASSVSNLRVRIDPGDKDKIFTALAAFDKFVDRARLWDSLQVARRGIPSASAFLESIVEKAQGLGKKIVFPEGDEVRTIRACSRLARGKVLVPILLGDPQSIRKKAAELGADLEGVEILDPSVSEKKEEYAQVVYEIRKHRRGGMTLEGARQWIEQSRIHFGTAMVRCGDADGLVSGAVHSTADTIRPAFQIIGVRPGLALASSVFLMVFKDRVLVYGDCAIVPDPDAGELADIAIASAHTARAFGIEPRVAMLSYSTGRSGSGKDVDKVAEATRIVRQREPYLLVDGPIQYDAAIDPTVAKTKQPDSPVAGRATVFIFPDLNSGNIAYKAVQRMSGAKAVGPVIQGLRKPVNDLSRGCTSDEIYYVAALTAVQAAREGAGEAMTERREADVVR